MLKLSLIALAAVVALLLALALLPDRTRAVPDETIRLENARVTLYPQADPEAVWTFRSDNVAYDPNVRETTLRDIEDSERAVAGETDFTLESPELTIDPQDNLRGDRMFVHLVEANWDLDMQGADDERVLIDQAQGKFIIPMLDYTGEGLGECNHAERVSMNFDLTDYTAGGEDTTSCNEFKDEDPEGDR